jgi:hypothetical protein
MDAGFAMPKGQFNSILIGERFGRLVVIERIPGSGRVPVSFRCRCDCGQIIVRPYSNLRGLRTRSCGCLRRQNTTQMKTTHGGRRLPEYRTWCHIIDRCCNPKSADHYLYGGRGITICERWRNSFSEFLSDVGRRPSPRHSIDRFPNRDGNYEPGNVRWATADQQANNTRRCRFVEFDGNLFTVAQLARALKLNRRNLNYHLLQGRSVDEAVRRERLKGAIT